MAAGLSDAEWKFLLCHSYGDMPAIGELDQARGKTLTKGLNRSGNLNFNVPLDYELGYEIDPITTCVQAIKNDKPVWSGPVWQTDEKTSANESKMDVSCVGWYEFANVRFVRTNVAYPATEDAQVAFDLINNHLNAPGLLIPAGSIDGILVPAPATGWFTAGTRRSDLTDVPYTPVVRGAGNLAYQAWSSNIGASIQALCDLEDGFDWEIDPITRQFDVWRKKMRETEAVFAAHWGPKNLASAGRQTNADQMRNFFHLTGNAIQGDAYNNDADPDHPDTRKRFGYFEEVVSLSDVRDAEILGAYGNAELALREWPVQTHSIAPFPVNAHDNVPSIFEDFDIGDKLYFVVQDGRFNTGDRPQGFRLFGATVSITEESNEQITGMQIYYTG